MKNIWLCRYLLLMIGIFVGIEVIGDTTISPNMAAIIAFIVCLICSFCFFIHKKLSFIGMTGVIFLYTLITQFGFVWVYFFLGSDYLSDYSSYTLRFLESPQLTNAILIGIMAIIVYTISATSNSKFKISLSNSKKKKTFSQTKNHSTLVCVGYIFLIIVFLFYCYYITIGAFKIGRSYMEFRNNVIATSDIYAYILMLYSMGIIFIVATGTEKQIKIGIALYSLSAIILLLTGNKGEVFYSVLACIGVAKYRKFKINKKVMLLVSCIIFVIIPFITANRESGIMESFNNLSLNFTDAFTEMGMQIRVSVYTLDEFANGTRSLMYGYSYYAPVINIVSKIIPFLGLRLTVPRDYNFLTNYAGMGFSQVAESYCNFGLFGVLIFFFVIGRTIARMEKKELNNYQLAFAGCLTSILINVTRNRFAFVIGQTLIIYLIISAIKYYDWHMKKDGGYYENTSNC